MDEISKTLAYLAFSGVEWELAPRVFTEPSSGPNAAAAHGANGTFPPLSASAGGAGGASFSAPKAARPQSAESILAEARRLAEQDDIVRAATEFKDHPLFSGAKNTVAPSLSDKCRLLVITDIPSASDDAGGRILSGAEGELFDKMMAAINLSRADISITPLVFWRPAGGRPPTADELSFCRPFVDRVIADSVAEKILLLGAVAAREIAGLNLPREHGKVATVIAAAKSADAKKSFRCVATYKPDFIIANPSVKKNVWEAIKLVIGA